MKIKVTLTAAAAAAMSCISFAETFTAFPSQDNTLYQSATGGLSNGAGGSIFAGVTNNGELRRALVQFDLSSLPSSATITSASLRITQDRQGPGGPASLSLHRVTASWGEGTSSGSGGGALATNGDATWLHRFYSTSLWTSPGGDFDTISLSAVTASGTGNQTFASSLPFVSVVQGWLQTPAGNFGLMLKEATTAAGAAARFYSRNNADTTIRPLLTLGFDRLTSSWTADANGTWSDSANWSAGVPNSFGIIARFAGPITAPRTITQPVSHTVGQLKFDSAQTYTISGAGQLNLDNGVGFASRIDVSAGNHRVESTVTTARETRIDTVGSTGLYIAELLSTSAVAKEGAGTLQIGTAVINGTAINGGRVELTSSTASELRGLNIVGGVLDLKRSGMIQPTLTTDLEAQFAARVGDISAARIQTSDAVLTVGIARSSDLSLTSFMGRPVANPSILLRATFAGDGNLDGVVNFDDLLVLAQRYGLLTGARWVDGDSNRDGKVDFDDLLALAQRYGFSLSRDGQLSTNAELHDAFAGDWQRALSLVPEPTSAVTALALMPCLRRRR